MGYGQIRKYAPDDLKYTKAVESIRYKFELITLFFVSTLIKYVVMAFNIGGSSDGSDDNISLLAYLSRLEFMSQFYVSGRCTLALILLSILIGSRFLGYFSIGL